MDKKGFTLVELMVVTGLVAVIFSMLVTIMINSDTHWKRGQNKLFEHQEARKIADSIAASLKEASPRWTINGTVYAASISESNKRLDFYSPVFDDATDEVTGIRKVTYKINPGNERELLVKNGNDDFVVLSGELEDIYFGGSCGCLMADTMDCVEVNITCPSVRIVVQTLKDNPFNLTTHAAMRNYVNVSLSSLTGIEEPEEGEF